MSHLCIFKLKNYEVDAIFEHLAGKRTRTNKERARLEEAYALATARPKGFLVVRPYAPQSDALWANFTNRIVE